MDTSTAIMPLLMQEVRAAIRRASVAGKLGSLTTSEQADAVPLVVEIPKDPSYGDYASPSALGMAKVCRLAPAAIAAAIAAEFAAPDIEVSVAGAGFLNFRLKDPFLARGLAEILALGESYGRMLAERPEKVLLEYVSANPTGPLHVGHGRWAAVGSTLANLLRWTGHHVDREFYINDAGNQMQILGRSLWIRVRQLQGESLDLPEDAYRGEYLIDLAQRLLDQVRAGQTPMPTDLAQFTDYAYAAMLRWQQQTLHDFQTDFEQWFSERRLHAVDPTTGQSAITQALSELQEHDFLYQALAPRGEDPKPNAEAAVYFKTQEFGDDKDRVVEKADGSKTYLAADIAYHRDKVRRGYDRLINILGSDHHGYIGRLNAAVKAFDAKVELEVIIGQFVKLFKQDPITQEKIEVRMSKRTGNFVSLNDLIEDDEIGVGVDPARWFLISTSMDSPINFDLDLAIQQTKDNPVFYAQYAHTRCASLLRRVQEEYGVTVCLSPIGSLPWTEPQERILLLRLLAFPDLVQQAAAERAPHKVTAYALEVASDLNLFYDHCRIFPLLATNPQDPLALLRLQLVAACRQVLANLLTQILGINAPTAM